MFTGSLFWTAAAVSRDSDEGPNWYSAEDEDEDFAAAANDVGKWSLVKIIGIGRKKRKQKNQFFISKSSKLTKLAIADDRIIKRI